MRLRLATHNDLPALLALVRRVVPIMRAAGNLQWDDSYPNAEVFARDVQQGQLWIAELSPPEQLALPDGAAVSNSEAPPEDGVEATASGRVAGVAAITTDQEPEYAQAGMDPQEPAIVVHRLAVDPRLRGRGIAVALMQQAEVVARERGLSVLRVDTNSANLATQALFPRLGYQSMGEISLPFRPGLRFRCYEKRLG